MALYTPLSSEQLSEVLRRYGLPPPERAVPEPKGSVNTNYHLWAGGKRWFLRLNEGKTAADVAFEAEVLRFLAQERFPAAPLALTTDGASQIEVAGRPAMLFAFAPGAELQRADVTPVHARRIGVEMGRLHAIAPRFEATRPNPYGWKRVEAWIAELGPDAGGDMAVAPSLPLLRGQLADLRSLPAAPSGLVHGDLFLDNVLWEGDRVSALLDWEMSGIDAFVYDVAVMLNAWCYGDRFDPALARAFLAGYAEQAALDRAAAGALYPYARYVALRYTASRIHAFHRAELSRDRLAWKDWTRYRDRLTALVDMGEKGFRDLVGL
jgi:homoserine kinase type II